MKATFPRLLFATSSDLKLKFVYIIFSTFNFLKDVPSSYASEALPTINIEKEVYFLCLKRSLIHEGKLLVTSLQTGG